MIRNNLRTYLLTLSAVDALDGQKVYVERSPQGKTYPHIVVDLLDDDHTNALDGTGGLVFAECEIDCKTHTPSASDTLAAAVKAEIDDYTGAMGDLTCQAVIFNGYTTRVEEVGDKSDIDRYVTTLNVQIQYS